MGLSQVSLRIKVLFKNSLPKLSWWWVALGGDETLKSTSKDSLRIVRISCKDFLRDSLRTLGGWWVFAGGWWPVGGGGEVLY